MSYRVRRGDGRLEGIRRSTVDCLKYRKALMKRLIMMLLLVALAIPATAFATPFGTTGHGTCKFTTNDKAKTVSLVADCTTDTTIGVPDGYTLDGKGFTIRAVDGISELVQRRGRPERRHHDARQEPQDQRRRDHQAGRLRPLLQRRRLHGRERLDQGRHADRHRAPGGHRLSSPRPRDPRRRIAGTPRQSVEISGNVVSLYNKNGIDVRGNVDATIIRNTVTGSASTIVARNGIVVPGPTLSRPMTPTR